METIEILNIISDLPLTGLLLLAVFFLWRYFAQREKELQAKIDDLTTKYQDVLVDMGKLHGKVDAEIAVEQKFEMLSIAIEQKFEMLINKLSS